MPATFELAIQVAPEDIDALNHVNNVVYLRYAQDVAGAHWRADAPPEMQASAVWVVRRHEIDYLRPAFAGETLIARTRVGAYTAVTWDRHIDICRPGEDKPLAQVRSVWVLLDAATNKPRRIDERVLRCFLDDI